MYIYVGTFIYCTIMLFFDSISLKKSQFELYLALCELTIYNGCKEQHKWYYKVNKLIALLIKRLSLPKYTKDIYNHKAKFTSHLKLEDELVYTI